MSDCHDCFRFVCFTYQRDTFNHDILKLNFHCLAQTSEPGIEFKESKLYKHESFHIYSFLSFHVRNSKNGLYSNPAIEVLIFLIKSHQRKNNSQNSL